MIDPEIHEAPPGTTTRTLRQFAGLWLLVLCGLAGWHGIVHDGRALTLVLGAVGTLVGVLGLTKPRAVGPLFKGLMILTYPVGLLVSRVLLGLLFYGMFTPLAVFFRLIGRDALLRRGCPDRPSHWVPKAVPTDVRSYLRES
jgi:hypothetical protein